MFEIMLADGQAKPVMMYPVREKPFSTTKYGDLSLTRKMAEEMIANFKAKALGTDPFIDTEHDEGASNGWYKDLYLDDAPADVKEKTGAREALYATVDWTPRGKKLLSEGVYKYISPWFGDHKDPSDGKISHNVLLGAALTNKPVLRFMPAIELSEGTSLSSKLLSGIEGVREFKLSELTLSQTKTTDGSSLKVGDKIRVQTVLSPHSLDKVGDTGKVTELEGANVYWKRDSDGKELNTWSGHLKNESAVNDGNSSGLKPGDNIRINSPGSLDHGQKGTVIDTSHLSPRAGNLAVHKVQWENGSISKIGGNEKAFEKINSSGGGGAGSQPRDAQGRWMSETNLADYPWDQCMTDMMDKYGDEETAKKVCGMIRSQHGAGSGKKLADVLPEVEKKLSISSKQVKPNNGGEDDMKLSDETMKALGLSEDASAQDIAAAVKKLADTKTENPDVKKLQDEISAQTKQLAEMQRKELERHAFEIVGKEIKGADGRAYKLSAPAQRIITEILLSESPTEFKLSEKDGDDTKEVTVSLADALDKLVDNLALVQLGETTKQKHDKLSAGPGQKVSEAIDTKLSEKPDASYAEIKQAAIAAVSS